MFLLGIQNDAMFTVFFCKTHPSLFINREHQKLYSVPLMSKPI